MRAAERPERRARRLLSVAADGGLRHHRPDDLAGLLRPGDLVVANDAATLPASLRGRHVESGAAIEVRLAGWRRAGDPTGFFAVVFGAGGHRIPTERRPPPPALAPGDRLRLGPLEAVVAFLAGHPRLPALRFRGGRGTVLAGLARHGRPIQYAHVPEPLALWDVWTGLAARPLAFEPPSAGFALDWRLLAALRRRGVVLATLTHAAGISSTGDPDLDRALPFDEPYSVPRRTAAAVNRIKAAGGRVVAVGTTVVRALEAAARADGLVRAGGGVARGRIGRHSRLQVADALLTGLHEPGESHFELLQAFAAAPLLKRALAAAGEQGYRTHEFGDFLLVERVVPAAGFGRRLPGPAADAAQVAEA